MSKRRRGGNEDTRWSLGAQVTSEMWAAISNNSSGNGSVDPAPTDESTLSAPRSAPIAHLRTFAQACIRATSKHKFFPNDPYQEQILKPLMQGALAQLETVDSSERGREPITTKNFPAALTAAVRNLAQARSKKNPLAMAVIDQENPSDLTTEAKEAIRHFADICLRIYDTPTSAAATTASHLGNNPPRTLNNRHLREQFKLYCTPLTGAVTLNDTATNPPRTVAFRTALKYSLNHLSGVKDHGIDHSNLPAALTEHIKKMVSQTAQYHLRYHVTPQRDYAGLLEEDGTLCEDVTQAIAQFATECVTVFKQHRNIGKPAQGNAR